MRLHLSRLGIVLTLGATALACGERSPSASAPAPVEATPARSDREPGPTVTADAVTVVAGDTTSGPTHRVVGRVLDVAKRLGIAFTSNVMGELEPCG